MPYLRGYGPTTFKRADTPRSGQQAALARDLLDFMDALEIQQATLAGYDWGGRAACIVAALWPARVQGLVSVGGYNLQDIPASVHPADPEQEHRLWYQYYFHPERGRAGLSQNRRDFCRLLWRLWSPTWQFSEATYARSASAFDNPDFVDVVIQSYRHRHGYAPGVPELEPIEAQLSRCAGHQRPDDRHVRHGRRRHTVSPGRDWPAGSALHRGLFERHRRDVAGVGHNLPQEAPDSLVSAISDVIYHDLSEPTGRR